MNLQFRSPENDDVETIISLMTAFYSYDNIPFYPDIHGKALTDLLNNPNLGLCKIIELDEHAVGYFIICFGYSMEYHGKDAFLDELFIDAEFRGMGIGKRCMPEIERLCRENGVNAIHLEVDAGNEAAEQLYRQSGFSGKNRSLLTKWLK